MEKKPQDIHQHRKRSSDLKTQEKRSSQDGINDQKPEKEKKLGEYTVISVLGSGSFGVVYKCLSPDKRVVAIKKLSFYSQNAANDLEREGKLEKGLHHKNIVKCYEIFYCSKKIPHLVLEYCNQGSLADYLDKQKKKIVKENEALQIFCSVLQGLSFLHSQGIIHRDIKTTNILMHDGVYKISDFGLSLKLKGEQTVNQAWGTIPYMAPEVIENWRQYSFNVDTWALCTSLYIMMYNEYPFGCEPSLEAQLKRIRASTIVGFSVPKLSYQLNDTSEELHQLFFHIFQYEPSKRIDFKGILESPLMIKYVEQYNKQSNDKSDQIDFSTEIGFYGSQKFQKMLNEVVHIKDDEEGNDNDSVDYQRVQLSYSTEIMEMSQRLGLQVEPETVQLMHKYINIFKTMYIRIKQ